MGISGHHAFDAGFAARQRGEPRDRNPFPAGSEDHTSWSSAWDWLDEHRRDRRACLVEEGLGDLVGGNTEPRR
jgi:tetrahydromethanopterin S-methyltransferase subunit H